MRDLQADLDEFNHWIEAINRAIKAEAEVERQKMSISEDNDNLKDEVKRLRRDKLLFYNQESELILLRKVAEAAKHVKSAFEAAENYFDKESLYYYHLHDNYCRAETLLFETLEDLEGSIE